MEKALPGGFFKKPPEKNNLYQKKPWLAHYPPNVPHNLNLPDIPLTEFLNSAVQERPNDTAIIYFGRKLTFNQLFNYIKRATLSFDNFGVSKRDRVALIMPNMPQLVICYWALLRLGAVVVPINPLLSPEEITHRLKISGSRMAFVYDKVSYKLDNIGKKTSVQHIIKVCVGSYMPFFIKTVYKIQKTLHKKPYRFHFSTPSQIFRRFLGQKPVDVKSKTKGDDAAVMLFTGGVTGTPKGVLLTHRNLVINSIQCQEWIPSLRKGKEVILAILPFFHSYGLTACLHLATAIQSTLIIEPRFNVHRTIDIISRYNVSIFPGVPTIYHALVQRLKQKNKTLPSIQVCISGSAPLPAATRKQFENLTRGRLVEGYGLTEASPITHCNPLDGNIKHGSIGVPLANTEARIMDIKTGKPAPVGQPGELQVRGPQVMSSYWNALHETQNVLASDGWLHTGDLAKMDEDGFFYIVDRIKDIILYGGSNIYPGEVERVIMRHPEVLECAVVGKPDEYYGQVVKAFIVVKKGVTLKEKQITLFCRDKLAHFKIPKEIEFVDSLPKNFMGKIIKRHLVHHD